MRKCIALILSLVLALSLAACHSPKEEPQETTDPGDAAETPQQEPPADPEPETPAQEAPAETPDPEPVQQPSQPSSSQSNNDPAAVNPWADVNAERPTDLDFGGNSTMTDEEFEQWLESLGKYLTQ